jgi:hypothetical protein
VEPRRSDWLLTLSLVLIVASLFSLAKINLKRGGQYQVEPALEEKISIFIEGAVHKPGEVRVLVGSPLEAAVRKARPFLHADLNKLSLKNPVLEPAHIVVEELKEICVQVVGEGVEPQELRLAPGTRICDLRSKIVLKEGADRAIFKRKRQLKNREILEVRKKTVEQNSAL